MKKIEANIKKRYKVVFAIVLSFLVMFGILGNPNAVKAKTWDYTGLAQRQEDPYVGTMLFPGDVIKLPTNGYLHVRYYLNTGAFTDYELGLGNGFENFEAAWNGCESYEDIDGYRLRKSDFTFPNKPDTGTADLYVYEVFYRDMATVSRTLVNGEQADNCVFVRVIASPAHKVTFHDKNGDVTDTSANRYFYEIPDTEGIYLASLSDVDTAPAVVDDADLGAFIGWSNNADYFDSASDFDSVFIAKEKGFEWGEIRTADTISDLLNFYPVYECYETELEITADDYVEGNAPESNVTIDTNRPSDMMDHTVAYERINEDGTVEAIDGIPNEAGKYQVIVKFDKAGTTIVNSDGFLDSRAYSIAGAVAEFNVLSDTKLTEKPAAKTLTYNGSAQALVTEGKAEGGDVLYSLSKDGEFSKNVPTAKDAGDYTVWYKVKGNEGRSDIEVASADVTIAKKTVDLEWSDTEFEYDGKEHCPTATATGVCDGDTCNVTVTGAKTEAGKYTAKATALSNSNYELPKEVTKDFEIKAKPEEKKEETKEEKKETLKPGSVSVSIAGYYYGGKATSPVISSTTNDTSKATVTYKSANGSDSYHLGMPSEVGSYILKVTLPANDKYAECSATASFTVSYLPVPEDGYTLDGVKGSDQWYKTAVKIVPKKGYQISYGDRNHYSENPIKLEESMASVSFFLRDASTYEETAVIVVGNLRIDTQAPEVVDMRQNGTYFGDNANVLKGIVKDANIDRVLIGGTPVELKQDANGNMTFDLPVGKKKQSVTFTVYDKAGNVTEFTVITAPGWKKDGKVGEGEFYLELGEKCTLPESSNWGTNKGNTVFMGGIECYPTEEGPIVFSVR